MIRSTHLEQSQINNYTNECEQTAYKCQETAFRHCHEINQSRLVQGQKLNDETSAISQLRKHVRCTVLFIKVELEIAQTRAYHKNNYTATTLACET